MLSSVGESGDLRECGDAPIIRLNLPYGNSSDLEPGLMAVRAIKKREVEVFARCKEHAAEPLDAAAKDLIDNLIVPHLVEEFLRLYGPTSVVAQKQAEQRNTGTSSESELDSTP